MVDLDIFKLHDPRDTDGYICIHGLSTVISKQVERFGGYKKFAKFFNVSESAVKDWKNGRTPVPLFVLKRLFSSFNPKEKCVVLGIKRSKHRVKIQLEISEELAYFIGLILGDGSLAGPKSIGRGQWRIHFCGGDESSVKAYVSLVDGLFGVKAHLRKIRRQDGRSYFEAVFASKIVHRLLTNIFEVPAGTKHDKIKMPSILLSSSADVRASFLRGLFDTDGSVTGSKIKFATTSKILCEGIVAELMKRGFTPKVYEWRKGAYPKLFEVRLVRKVDIKKFCLHIGSSDPRKVILLERIKNNIRSPVG